MNIIAIDSGASGAICLKTVKGQIISVKMPKENTDIYELFRDWTETYGKSIVFIEKVMHWGSDDDSPGKKFGIAKMMKNYNSLILSIQIMKIPYVEVMAYTWQKKLGLRKKYKDKQQRKNAFKRFSAAQYPTVKVTLYNADALCVMSFATYVLKYNPSWAHERIKLPKGVQTKLV